MVVLKIIYLITALLLAVYAFNAWVLTLLYLKHRIWQRSQNPFDFSNPTGLESYPFVTIQLPIFNEALVVQRLLDAVTRFDYPLERLQIQVLDDSTDETTDLLRAKIDSYQRHGLNIELIHRYDRTGFKAGALAKGLSRATGEFIAIFDADFVPPPDFLKQTIPHLTANPKLGFVQGRWGHLNRSYSYLTAAQALAIDGHFGIEQTARHRSGFLMNFNGTAGVWRRDCIATSGGWQHDTLCEDFDLSYRAELQGWQVLFLPDVVAPAEIPPQLAAFKRQQFRWAKGSIQCLKKLGGAVGQADLPWFTKLQALIHLSSYLVHPLTLILTLITPILILNGGLADLHFPLIYLSLGSFGPPMMYAVAQATLYPRDGLSHYRFMPLLALLGGGVALNNSQAVIEAIFGWGSNQFRRTPKFNVASSADRWQNSSYRLPLDWRVLGELALCFYSIWGAWLVAVNGNPFAAPFILLYAFSFGYVGGQGLWDARWDMWDWLLAQLKSYLTPPVTRRPSVRPH